VRSMVPRFVAWLPAMLRPRSGPWIKTDYGLRKGVLGGFSRRNLNPMEATTAHVAHRPTLPAVLLGVIRSIGGWLIALAALLAGIGELYLIRDAALSIGPQIRGALPLEQLAGQSGQPLIHLVIAWVPAGFVAGLALASLTRLGSVARTISLAALAAAVLLLAGALSDSIAVNDPLSPHLVPQLSRVGTWVAVALFAAGSACAGLLRPSRT
jgi:hypothetical protein